MPGREYGRPATARRLPLPAAPDVPAVPDDVVYGFGRMDESGRVADRAMTSALGWQRGDRLTLTAAAPGGIARCDPAGMITMSAKPHLVVLTFADYIPVVSAAVSAGTRQAYGSYWNRVIEQWGGRRLDEPTPSEIRHLMAHAKTHVVARRSVRDGLSADHGRPVAHPYARIDDAGLHCDAGQRLDLPKRRLLQCSRSPHRS